MIENRKISISVENKTNRVLFDASPSLLDAIILFETGSNKFYLELGTLVTLSDIKILEEEFKLASPLTCYFSDKNTSKYLEYSLFKGVTFLVVGGPSYVLQYSQNHPILGRIDLLFEDRIIQLNFNPEKFSFNKFFSLKK